MTQPPYPPQPWHLRGEMYISVWRVPPHRLPPWQLPPGVTPLTTGRRCSVVTFWVDYQPGGTLTYHELLVALAVKHRRSVAATAVAVWVDDEQSLAGGRELWNIPKEPGAFAFAPPGTGDTHEPGDTHHPRPAADSTHPHPHPRRSSVRMRLLPEEGAEETAAVHGTHHDVLRLPARLPLRTRLLQQTPAGNLQEVPLRLHGTPAISRARITTDPTSPLAFLNNHRPTLSLTLHDFRFTVGS